MERKLKMAVDNNKVPWDKLLDELTKRDARWEKFLCLKIAPLQAEIKGVHSEMGSFCKRLDQSYKRIEKLELANAVRVGCKQIDQARAEVSLKRWHLWLIGLGIVASPIITAVLFIVFS